MVTTPTGSLKTRDVLTPSSEGGIFPPSVMAVAAFCRIAVAASLQSKAGQFSSQLVSVVILFFASAARCCKISAARCKMSRRCSTETFFHDLKARDAASTALAATSGVALCAKWTTSPVLPFTTGKFCVSGRVTGSPLITHGTTSPDADECVYIVLMWLRTC